LTKFRFSFSISKGPMGLVKVGQGAKRSPLLARMGDKSNATEGAFARAALDSILF
jgi:hypothetical protein